MTPDTPPLASRPPRRILHSVYAKLLLVVLITGLGITMLVIGFFIAYRHMVGGMLHSQGDRFVRYFINQLGTPPSLDRALILSRELGVQIYYQGPQARWSTNGEELPPNLDRLRIWYEGPDHQFGSVRGHPLLIVNRGSEQIIFDSRFKLPDHSRGHRLLLIFLTLMLFLLAGSYGLIRWLLRPLRPLHEGVLRVSQGDLDHRIHYACRDEFQDLAAAFNTMTDRIGKLLSAKERLLLDVSHELRSPITRMKVALEMLPAGAHKDGLKEDLIEMERMVTEILEAYRAMGDSGDLQMARVDLAALLKETAALFADTPPGIAPCDLQSIWITADAHKLKSVLTNLLDNALKYSRTSAAALEIGLNQAPDSIEVYIRDHGKGIPRDALPHVFEPFYRVDTSRTRATGGFGLGLSLCKAVVEAHGGTIALDSVEGRGTTVTIRLPKFPDQPQPVPRPEKS